MHRKLNFLAIMLISLLPSFLLLAESGDGAWIARVPEKARVRPNPFSGDANAITSGAKLFRQNCAQCHGDEGVGREKHPRLQSERIRQATPGELEWLIANGSLRNGMPSW